ncbi:serine/threonine-protein kinase [Nitrosococcus wardiae]|uniref:non-specific serine/threonine protein kinase n=1 Tax=Nitrosococcus wardiae TaxID=1814290 RepID=A0A4P7BTB1_9GAMM|nr:serine/threonine-protein kinase [Nitrosococcus wardiae]QBQ53101.1 serine/threonine protein kinase [Nitrosococcus wardiae]
MSISEEQAKEVSSLKIPGYKIQRMIGQGGMAKVYLAIQESLDRKIALKIMTPPLDIDHSLCERFLKEGKIVAQLSHPSIVTVYDVGCFGNYYYMAMEYLGGANLKQRIQQQAPLACPLKIIRQVASALGYAHAHGFVHRDVKPANILFKEDGTAVLTDFGIAKPLTAHTQLTAVGFCVGTPEYMSPEQATGKKLDGRSDLYSLGVVFYEMLTGQKPFIGEDAIATILMHAQSPIPSLPSQFATYQPLVERLLAKDPNDRFEDAGALITFVDHFSGLAEREVVQKTGTSRLFPTQVMAGETRVFIEPSPEKKSLIHRTRRWTMGIGLLAVVFVGTYLFFSPRL